MPVGGRLQRFVAAWEKGEPEAWVVQCLKEGYAIPFAQPPPLSDRVLSLTAYQRGTERFAALEAEVLALLAKEAIVPVVPETPGFYGRLFVVPKLTGGWRPVLDVSELNRYVSLTKFKMETPRSVLASVQEGDWMTSVDLKDAYLQVPMHPESCRFLRFVFDGVCCRWKVRPFGLSTAGGSISRTAEFVSIWPAGWSSVATALMQWSAPRELFILRQSWGFCSTPISLTSFLLCR